MVPTALEIFVKVEIAEILLGAILGIYLKLSRMKLFWNRFFPKNK